VPAPAKLVVLLGSVALAGAAVGDRAGSAVVRAFTAGFVLARRQDRHADAVERVTDRDLDAEDVDVVAADARRDVDIVQDVGVAEVDQATWPSSPGVSAEAIPPVRNAPAARAAVIRPIFLIMEISSSENGTGIGDAG
jgi:hypothetical protein